MAQGEAYTMIAFMGPPPSELKATFYDEPVALIRGEGVWVWDTEGRQYLDCYNNVPHVGHWAVPLESWIKRFLHLPGNWPS